MFSVFHPKQEKRLNQQFKNTTALAAVLLASSTGLASAQDTQDNSNAAPVDQIVVTGTRIVNPNMESPNPINTMDSQTIGYTGKTSVQEIVLEIGALVGSEGEGEVSNGENFLILRNLGANRTLVLVDGQRFVSGAGGTSAVDTNLIPVSLIERVDVFTGGASAIYGADAVTGVVNFILKDDFEGLALNGQYGNAFKGDFTDYQLSLTAGHNFDDGRGNITANYSFGHRPLTPATARADASTLVHEQINNINGDIPQFVLAPGTRESFFTEGGARFDPFGIFSGGFNGDGTPFEHGVNVGSFAGTGEIGGDGIPNWILFAQAIRPKNTRHIGTIKAHYDVSEAFTPYANLHYSNVNTRQWEQHSLTVGSRAALDNAFLPASVMQAAMDAEQPFVFFNRWDIDSGFVDQEVDKDTYRLIFGAKGDFADNFHYDISANFGKTKRLQTIHNNRMFDRYQAAIDSVVDTNGDIVCRSDIDPDSFTNIAGDFLATAFDPSQGPTSFTAGPNSGCVPFDPFTSRVGVNDEAIAWIWIPTTSRLVTKQTVINGFIGGDTSSWFELPGGPIDFVVGAEYRKEESSVRFDALSNSDRNVAQFSGTDLAGQFDVAEGFVEASLPIVENFGPLVDSFTLDAAYRFSDYSTIGSTHTWKFGGVWNTAANITIRGTYSSAVRAPNIEELFEPRTNISISLLDDPCAIDNINLGSPTRAANCAEELNAIGVDPTTFDPLLGTFFPAVTGGNPDLKEETAKTKTVGIAWQPDFLDGASFSVDYFSINISDAVISPSQTAIFNACYDSPTLDNIFCTLIGRNQTTGAANFVEIEAVNVARIETSGIEFTAAYATPIDNLGDFLFSLNTTYLKKLKIQKSALDGLTDDKGLFNTDTGGSSPKWVLNADITWQRGNWDANYGFNYSSKTLRPPQINAQRDMAAEIIDDPFVDAFINHDIQVGYTHDERFRFYAGITNLSNEKPDKVRGSLNGPSGRQGFAGRTFYLGVNVTLADIFN